LWLSFIGLVRHPSGHFVQGDNTQLSLITRKARNRPDKAARRAAKLAKLGLGPDSNQSYDQDGEDDGSLDGDDHGYGHHAHGYSYDHSPPQLGNLQLPPVGWPTHEFRPQAFEERKPFSAPVFNHSWASQQQQHMRQPQPHQDPVNQWRWTEAQPGRRSSIPHIPLGITPIASQFANQGLAGSLGPERPTLRKAHSALSIHTTITEESNHPRSAGPHQDDDCSDRFQSPYPTPTLYPGAAQPGQAVYGNSYFSGNEGHYNHDARRDSTASHYVSSGLVGGPSLPSPTASHFSASPPNEVVPLPSLNGHLDPRALHGDLGAGARRFSMPQPAMNAQYHYPQHNHHQGPAQWQQQQQPLQLPTRAHEY